MRLRLLQKVTVSSPCAGLLHQQYAATVADQILSKLLANPQTDNHSLRRPEVSQQCWRQQQELTLRCCHLLWHFTTLAGPLKFRLAFFAASKFVGVVGKLPVPLKISVCWARSPFLRCET
eukprot:2509703-Rhodomonas_salina.2